MARLTLPHEEELTPEQRAACAEAVSGLRGRVPAPMGTVLLLRAGRSSPPFSA
jgi:hypothetical protein